MRYLICSLQLIPSNASISETIQPTNDTSLKAMSQVNVHLCFSSLSTVISIIHPLNDLRSAEDIFRAHQWCSRSLIADWLPRAHEGNKKYVQLFWKQDAEILILSIWQIFQFFGLTIMHTIWLKAFKFYKDMTIGKNQIQESFLQSWKAEVFNF